MTVIPDLIARVWMLDLRTETFIEMGGTSRPRDVWRSVRDRIETAEITDRGVPLALSPGEIRRVRRRAKQLAAHAVAADSHAVI